jgi:hypothetical protein
MELCEQPLAVKNVVQFGLYVAYFIGQKINQRNPKCRNIDELRTVILQEWQQFPQERLGRLD